MAHAGHNQRRHLLLGWGDANHLSLYQACCRFHPLSISAELPLSAHLFNLPLGELGNTRRSQRSSRCSASSGLTSIICTPIFIGGSGVISVGVSMGVSIDDILFLSYVLNARVIITAKNMASREHSTDTVTQARISSISLCFKGRVRGACGS